MNNRNSQQGREKGESSRIIVSARVRPLNRLEIEEGGEECMSLEEKLVEIRVDQERHVFTFDHVFGSTSTQQEVFQEVAQPVIEKVMDGFNGTIFAYGQTSSGKTYTMEGLSLDNELNKGIIPRMMNYVFGLVGQGGQDKTYRLECSFLEIYNERINDLLDTKRSNLQVKEDKVRGIYVGDVSEVLVQEENQMQQVIIQGNNNRSVASTRMNEKSSRSHSMFILNVQQKNSQGQTKNSRLYFVDLAGSEKISKTNVTGKQLEEAKNINKSLSALGNVINSLTSSKQNGFIPYRDSKLTRILQESLGGNSSTSIIIALSMCSYNDKESLSTLRFGQRAKTIKNRVSQNMQYTTSQLLQMVGQYKQQLVSQENMIQDYLKEIHNLSTCSIPDFKQSPKQSFDLSMLNDSSILPIEIQQQLQLHQQSQQQQQELQQQNASLSQIQINQQQQIDDIKRQKKTHHVKLLQKIREIQELNNKNRELQENVNTLEDQLFSRNQEIDEMKQKECDQMSQHEETIILYKEQLNEKQEIQVQLQGLKSSQHKISQCIETLKDKVNYILISHMMNDDDDDDHNSQAHQPSIDNLQTIQKVIDEMLSHIQHSHHFQDTSILIDLQQTKDQSKMEHFNNASAIQQDQYSINIMEKYEIKKNEWNNKINYYKQQINSHEENDKAFKQEKEKLQDQHNQMIKENQELKIIITENQEQKKMYENQIKINKLKEENLKQQKSLINNEQQQLKQQQLIQEQYSNQRQLQQNIDLLLNKVDILSSFNMINHHKNNTNNEQSENLQNQSSVKIQRQKHKKQKSQQIEFDRTSKKARMNYASQVVPSQFNDQQSLYSFKQSSKSNSSQKQQMYIKCNNNNNQCQNSCQNNQCQNLCQKQSNCKKNQNIINYQIEYQNNHPNNHPNHDENYSMYSQNYNPFNYISNNQNRQISSFVQNDQNQDENRNNGIFQGVKDFLIQNQYRIPAFIGGCIFIDLYVCYRKRL